MLRCLTNQPSLSQTSSDHDSNQKIIDLLYHKSQKPGFLKRVETEHPTVPQLSLGQPAQPLLIVRTQKKRVAHRLGSRKAQGPVRRQSEIFWQELARIYDKDIATISCPWRKPQPTAKKFIREQGLAQTANKAAIPPRQTSQTPETTCKADVSVPRFWGLRVSGRVQ